MSTVIRGCGLRVQGGVYSESNFSKNGLPIEHFLFDPPKVIDIDALGITPVGTRLIQIEGVYHIIDWIGSQHYPNVADWIEETRLHGMSRRLSSKLDFSKLTSQSMHILLHSHGYLRNWIELPKHREKAVRAWRDFRFQSEFSDFRCPKQYVSAHPNTPAAIAAEAFIIAGRHSGVPGDDIHPLPEMCSSMWYETLTTESVQPRYTDEEINVISRVGRRTTPSCVYDGYSRPAGFEPLWKPALIARMPITRLVVINGEEETVKNAVKAASAAQDIPVEVVND